MTSVARDSFTANARLPTVHVDESGNTGEHLTDAAQPVFVLAAVHLNDDDAARLAGLVGGRVGEAHYSTLRRRRRSQDKVLALLADPAFRTRETVRVSALLKPFMVIPKLVDLLIEPAMHDQGLDLYAGDWHLRITEVFASLGEGACPATWRPMLDAFVKASRRPSREAAARLGQSLAATVQEADGNPVADFLLLAIATPQVLLNRLTAERGYRSADALDPALAAAYEQVLWWGQRLGPLRLVHDESKLIGRWRDRLLAMADPAVAGAHRITESVVPDPLPLAALETAVSHDSPAVQVADVVAGACADVLRAAARAEEPDEWGLRLREARVLRFVDHLLWWAPGTRLREELEVQGLLGDLA